MRSTAIFKARAANKTVKHHPRSLSANEEGVSAMTPSRALTLRRVHTLHDMTKHVRSDTESLTLKLPSEMVSLAVDTELLAILPTLPGTIAFPPPLHQPPHHQPQARQRHHHQHREQDTKEIHWNLAIACAAPVAYAPNNASKYGALSGATCTNA